MGQKTTKLTNLHGLGYIHDPIINITPLTSLGNLPMPKYNSIGPIGGETFYVSSSSEPNSKLYCVLLRSRITCLPVLNHDRTDHITKPME